MFYYLDGTLALADDGLCVVDCGGVGYALTVGSITFANLINKIGQKIRLFTYLAVREDGVELFGFGSKEEKDAFMLLITVSGVGPKAALNVLSVFTPEELYGAIAAENVKAIAKANGVGSKTAARIILDLKDKVGGVDGFSGTSPVCPAKEISSPNVTEAKEALTALGYDKNSIAKVLKDIDPSLGVTDIIRLALKKMSER